MGQEPPGTAADIHHRIWTELQRATVDRHHEWRTPVLATTGLDGLPQARTVVLRAADATASQLSFFTDRRSPKVVELQAVPAAAFVFWSKRLNWQLRVRVATQVHTEGPLVDAAWARVSQSAAAGDYLSPQAPGSALGDHTDHEHGAHHLAVVTARIEHIDWLELARTGHRRARLTDDALVWLVP
ncbi:pyridoxamine 5'-phosphate oxidase family protein [Hydrogenophaga sp.]|jgi:pyridoxine/pyridoxamine 5'-phosphate oxidase|uniref:pyridoxamine 5'-phosphate oxidase family protein n=1 Tax=Hydrogenophaga sp. TaxID=1904254 RepID=UPI0025BDA54F|nr:pyridoxamine 5'-phosphate oxidase family protein [Hydrogenophaga sp.]MDO9504908.1 pyridoxamine 5'-phosphate oxidase family protein [Hydrogenophaga sp.]